MDILIRGGRVLDGNGNPWFRADVGIEGKRIVEVGDLNGVKASMVIDTSGLVVAPGFIDIHNHSDVSILADGRAESMVQQGVTTLVAGNCGMSPFPLLGFARESAERNYARDFGLSIDWSTQREYEGRLKKQGVSVNVGLYVGHGTIREAVMGHEDREPTSGEMRKMRRHVEDAVDAGCFGLSAGLGYAPGLYAITDELVDLCKIVAKHGGLYAPHVRSAQTFPRNLEEAIEVGERAGLPVQMAHIGSSTCQRLNWGNAEKVTLRIVDEARARGVDFTADIYPYVVSGGELTMYVPKWVQEGGKAEMMRRLADATERAKMRPEVGEMLRHRDWSQLLLYTLNSERYKRYGGKTVKQIAEEEMRDPMEVAYDIILAEDSNVPFMGLFGQEADIRALMRYGAVMIGSDGTAEPGDSGAMVHPRSFGTFPRVIGYYVREGVLTLPEAVHKMTGMPAWRLGLKDRGVIKPGAIADLTLFDPEKVRDDYTITSPPSFPEGIPHVIVNGVPTVAEGRHTGALAGEVLHKET